MRTLQQSVCLRESHASLHSQMPLPIRHSNRQAGRSNGPPMLPLAPNVPLNLRISGPPIHRKANLRRTIPRRPLIKQTMMRP